MSDQLYEEGGVAHFACPVIAAVYAEHGGRTWEEWDDEERQAHAQLHAVHGHGEWFFHWRKGAHHVDHAANGGVPRCPRCKARLVHVAGSDPGHKR